MKYLFILFLLIQTCFAMDCSTLLKTPPETLEQKIYLIESITLRSPVHDFKSEQLLTNSNYKKLKKLISLLNTLDFKAGVSILKLKKFTSHFHEIIYGKSNSLNKFFKSMSEQELKNSVLRLVQEQIFFDQLVVLVKNFNGVRENSFHENISGYSNIRYVQYFKTILLNIPMIYTYFPTYFPEDLPLTYLRLPSELLDRIKNEGFDSVWPELKNIFSTPLTTSYYYNKLRLTYITLVFAFIFNSAMHINDDMAEHERDVINKIKSDAHAVEHEPQVIDQIQSEFENEILEKTGKLPDPNSPIYKLLKERASHPKMN